MPKPIINQKSRYVSQSLSFRVSVFIAATLLVVLLVFSSVFVLSERQSIKDNILRNGITFATFSANSIYEHYSDLYTHPEISDFRLFQRKVQGTIKQNTDVTRVTLVGLNGRILFDSDEFTQGKYAGSAFRELTDQETIRRVQSDTTSYRDITIDGATYTEIVVPLEETGGGHLLSMRYLISYNSLSQQMQPVYQRIAIVTLLLFVLVLIVAVLFSLGMVRPIIRLNRIAARLRSGDLDARADTSSKDEIGRLGMTLNDMAARLKSYYTELEQKVRERTRQLEQAQQELELANMGLESKVQQRTRELSEAQAQLMSSVRALPFGFMLSKDDGEVIIHNPAMQRILGIVDDITAPNISQISDLFKNVMDQAQMSLATKETINHEFTTEHGRYLRILHSPVMDGQRTIGVVTLVEDITEAKVLERSKDEFFSIASHELRTPLTAIRGNASLIEEYYAESLTDESLQRMVHDIHESSTRLIEMVNDFLDASSLEQGKISYHLQPLDLAQIIAQISHELAGSLRQKGLSMTVDASVSNIPLVFADQNRVKQIIYNLAGNAIKFTQSGGITLSAESGSRSVKIFVTDTGRGIAPDKQPFLFRKFQQAGDDLFTRDTLRGTGLGLYISHLLCSQMGGDLVLERSEEGIGTTFSFMLPIASKADIAEATVHTSGNA